MRIPRGRKRLSPPDAPEEDAISWNVRRIWRLKETISAGMEIITV